jgi:hypothetical protein
MHYFPLQKISLNAPPKTGCTSLLGYFVRREIFLEDQDQPKTNTSQSYVFDENKPWMVHEQNRYSHHRFQINPSEVPRNDSLVSICVIRKPSDRFRSFWFDKIVRGDDPYYRDLSLQFFPEQDPTDLDCIQKRAFKFLESLSQTKIEEYDDHYLPQLHSNKGSTFNLIIDTDNLFDLTGRIKKISTSYEEINDISINKFNTTESFPKKEFFWNEILLQKFNNIYGEDLLYYKKMSKEKTIQMSPLLTYLKNRQTSLLNKVRK